MRMDLPSAMRPSICRRDRAGRVRGALGEEGIPSEDQSNRRLRTFVATASIVCMKFEQETIDKSDGDFKRADAVD